MSEAVYADHEAWEFYWMPVYLSLAFFVLALFVAIPKDRARRLIWKHGRRLRGPELVSTAEFNTKLGKSSLMRVAMPDGIAFVNEEGSWWDKLVNKSLSRWVHISRDREAMHFLIVGDSGTGKSATIRQLLEQIADRGEAAIVYDPAMEYLPQFYSEERGDVVLDPLDARCPFWTPGDEVPYEAEALTLAVSLFPDQGRENRFFVEAPRKIFAHLINQRPTPRELTYWMSNADEIDNLNDTIGGAAEGAGTNGMGGSDQNPGKTKLGLTVTDLPPNAPAGLHGVMIQSVVPGSFADELDPQVGPGLVIEGINRKPIQNTSDFNAIVSGLHSGEDVVLQIASPDSPKQSALTGGVLP